MAADDFAYLDTIKLQMENIEDVFEKAIVRHERPFTQGADLEDMGQKARVIRIRCHFWDDATNRTYDEHVDLIDHLSRNELFELIHPKYGVLQVAIESVTVRHDDRERQAEIDLSLVEQLRRQHESTANDDPEAAVEAAFVQGQEEALAAVEEEAREELGAEADDILNQDLDPEQGILEQYKGLGLTKKGWDFVRRIDAAVRTLEAQANAVTNPANSLLAMINFGTNLPGRLVGTIARCAERYARLYDSLRTSPVRFFDSFRLGMMDLESKVGFGPHIRRAAAHRAGVEAAAIYKDDEQNRQALRRVEETPAFDRLGRYRKQADYGQVLTVRDLEDSLVIVRTMMQDAIDVARESDSIRSVAATLLQYVTTVKIERENLIEVVVDPSLPLHLVCLKYGLPYNYAERIRTVNRGISNPNFTKGAILIYGR